MGRLNLEGKNLGQTAAPYSQNMNNSSVMTCQGAWAQNPLQGYLGKGASKMSLEKTSGRPWICPGGMEDKTIPFIPEYGGSDGKNECAYV